LKIRLGVITYGRVASSGAMRRVSPIIKQIPFSIPDVVMSALKDQHDSFGIGIGTATSSGGMAVLEALVAAIEVRPRSGVNLHPYYYTSQLDVCRGISASSKQTSSGETDESSLNGRHTAGRPA
jgi:hypothetical protein